MYFIEVMGAELPDEGQALTAAGSYTLVSTFIPEDAAEPEAIVRPTALAFGSVAIGDSALLLFTVRSAGGGTVSVDAPFSVQQGAEVNVGPGESQTVIIRFQPTRVGTFGAFVLLMLNTGEVQVPVGGTATLSPQLMVTTGSDFIVVTILTPTCAGATSTVGFTVRNTGGGTLTGSASVSGSQFTLISGGTFSLGPNKTASGRVRFDFETEGTLETTLTITSNAGNATRKLRAGCASAFSQTVNCPSAITLPPHSAPVEPPGVPTERHVSCSLST